MATAHVFLKITMEWDFEESELNNLFEDATICLPSGEDIKNRSLKCPPRDIGRLPVIDCLSVVIGM